MDPVTWAAVIGAVANVLTAPGPQAAPAISRASQQSFFDTSNATVATSGSKASGATGNLLWFVGGFATVFIIGRLQK